MKRKFVFALLVSAVLTLGGGAVLTHAASAAGGSEPDAMCSSTSPCLTEKNTSSGAGVQGSGAHGTGVVGTTTAKGTTGANGRGGVLGQDLQSTTGYTNAGVIGTTTNGTGVRGTGINGTGVLGSSQQSFGVEGVSSGFAGVLGSATTVGVEGSTSSSKGIGVLATTTAAGASLIRGRDSNGADVFTVDDRGNVQLTSATVLSYVSVIGSVFGGASLSTDIGVRGQGKMFGVEGRAIQSGSTAVSADSLTSNTNLYEGINGGVSQVFLVDEVGNVFAHSFNTTSASTIVQKTSAGQKVGTYLSQASQPSLEDFGEAQLADGIANVRLDPTFGAAIDRRAYLVTVTPEGDCRGLYVAQKSVTGFTIRELQGGRSSIAFSYRIVAKPFGSTSLRLPAASYMPRGFEREVHPPSGSTRRDVARWGNSPTERPTHN